MNAVLHTADGETLSVEIRSLRAFPMLLKLESYDCGTASRYFVRTGGPTDGDYAEAKPEPVIKQVE